MATIHVGLRHEQEGNPLLVAAATMEASCHTTGGLGADKIVERATRSSAVSKSPTRGIPVAVRRSTAAVLLITAAMTSPPAEAMPQKDVHALFDAAERRGSVGRARKSRPVDVRPADEGEIVVTVIAGQGEETRSPPAGRGDMVVRNRCPETGNEEILVAGEKFVERYQGPIGPADAVGWLPYRPRGVEMAYFIVPEDVGSFQFTAPWGEEMVAHPGDTIVRDPEDSTDTYRIAAAAFACTYEVLVPAR